MTEFFQKLKELRAEKGVRQKDVAEAIGVSTNAIANYEQGTREPNFQILAKLCVYYNVSADYMIGLTDY